jgi:membrane protease subunit HflK
MCHDHQHPHEHGPGCGHDHPHDHGHSHPPATPPAPETPLDSGSQALASALKSSFGIVKIAMVALLVVFLCSGFFTVGPQERAIVLRFGKPVGGGQLLSQGLKFALPYPIDEVVKVPITELQRVSSTVGWFFTTPEMELAGNDPYAGPSLNPAVDGYLVTGDQNIVHARATLNYRIEDPVQYIFGFEGETNRPFSGTGASNLVLNALNSALVKAAGEFKVDDILYSDVLGFKDAVRRKVTEQLAVQKLGVVVEQVEVSSRPPLFLKAEFARVNVAVQQRGKLINEAQAEANQTLSQADAKASAMRNLAEVERDSLINKLKGEAARFTDLLPAYRQNPGFFTERYLTETMARVLTNVQDKIYLNEKTDELRLLLNREPQKINREQKP